MPLLALDLGQRESDFACANASAQPQSPQYSMKFDILGLPSTNLATLFDVAQLADVDTICS
jgi:hypothetical protein